MKEIKKGSVSKKEIKKMKERLEEIDYALDDD